MAYKDWMKREQAEKHSLLLHILDWMWSVTSCPCCLSSTMTNSISWSCKLKQTILSFLDCLYLVSSSTNKRTIWYNRHKESCCVKIVAGLSSHSTDPREERQRSESSLEPRKRQGRVHLEFCMELDVFIPNF